MVSRERHLPVRDARAERHVVKRSIVLTGVGVLALLFARPAFAYAPVGVTCGVSSAVVLPGQNVLVSGQNWLAGSNVNLVIHSASSHLGGTRVGAKGSFSKQVVIPRGLPKGRHHVTITGKDGAGHLQTQSCSLLVGTLSAPHIAGGPGEIAFTGANFLLGIAILFGLTVIGFLALALGRRKARSGAGT
jgi:hypothetical protein